MLIFDPQNRRVAVKKGERGDLRAYPVKKHAKNNATIPATNFFKHYDIDTSKTVRHTAKIEGEMLVTCL